ncbi:hypothetical protein [Nesterenkonia sp. HG001]|uniref:hypothetical protein n=1 Tax=Nesterenkonia sp. HG001 TaxID=2983207 RepID=UPI002AC4384F|nr:hypothetical protein [Nesterenkonia sp. HG001]MDZ5078626.1 hypothetical protein [Nesterenkonia sp. HG001]
MRFLSSILAFLLGLAALAAGIGLLSVWAPQEVSTAQTSEVEEAPLTVITDGVVDPEQGSEEFTIEAEGEFTIALARLDDIDAWVDDAAHVRITGVEEGSAEEPPSVVAEHVDGEAQVPDPSGSDLWVATEIAEGSLEYRWVAPDDSGDWGLMLFRDGEEAAPAAVAVEVEQPVDRTLGIALSVAGALLILLALLLSYRAMAARRRERDVLAAAYDGEVVPEDAQEAEGADVEDAGASEPTDATTATTITPAAGEESEASSGTLADAEAADRAEIDEEDADDKDVDGEEVMDLTSEETTVIPATPGVEETSADGETTAGPDGVPVREEDDATAPAPSGTPDEDPAAEDLAAEGPAADSQEPGRRSFWWRSSSVAVLAAVAVTAVPGADITGSLRASPEEAEEQAEEQAEEEFDDADAEDAGADVPEAGEYSVLLESQLQHILEDIVEVVEAGDEDQDAEVLEERVDGNALEVRELTYRNQEISDAAGPEPIGSAPLAAAVTSSTEFPRQAVVITRHEESEIPQVLVIEQDSPRENYRLTQAVMMMPGTEFPAIAAEEGGIVPVDPEAEVARFAPDYAMIRTAVFLNNREYYFGAHVEDNPYIEDLQSYQEEVREAAADVEISYTRPLVEGSTTALRLPDGSVLAVGSFDSTMQLRPLELGDQIIFEDETLAELAGTQTTTADADVINRESMILHIPAEDEDQVVLLGVHDIVSDVNILD